MTTIQAWQHIYSNVEKEQSPAGRGGFQTLFYSKAGLTADDISEMEGRLLYFPAKTSEPVKRLFFTTASGKAVVAQIVVLPEPDQFGRRGRYLAHALAMPLAGLAQFEADPFAIFHAFTFFTTVAEALAHGDFNTGDIPAVRLTVPAGNEAGLRTAQSWPVAELKKLALLALRVEQQAAQREAVTVAGQPAEIEQALAAAFLVVPPSLRPRCTFDTYFYRCNLVATFYWAIGLPEPPVSVKFALVDAAARRVSGTTPTPPHTAYERWVVALIEAGQLAEIVRQRTSAFALGEWLDERAADPAVVEAAPAEVVARLFAVNAEAVDRRCKSRLAEVIPAPLVDRAAAHFQARLEPLRLFQKLRHDFTPAEAVTALYESYAADHFAAPPVNEVKALESLLAEAPHALLSLFVALWVSPRRQLLEALQTATEADYRHFVETVFTLRLIDPLKLLVSGRSQPFLDIYLKSNEVVWPDLAETLVAVGETAGLSRLAKQAATLSRRELQVWAAVAETTPEVPADFREAVEQAVVALPPEGGLKGLLKAAWRRLPGVGE